MGLLYSAKTDCLVKIKIPRSLAIRRKYLKFRNDLWRRIAFVIGRLPRSIKLREFRPISLLRGIFKRKKPIGGCCPQNLDGHSSPPLAARLSGFFLIITEGCQDLLAVPVRFDAFKCAQDHAVRPDHVRCPQHAFHQLPEDGFVSPGFIEPENLSFRIGEQGEWQLVLGLEIPV